MKYVIDIPHNGENFRYYLLRNTDFQLIHLDNCVHILIAKHHNHKYEIAGFFYRSQHLVYPRIYTTKKELYGAIQKLLQEFL